MPQLANPIISEQIAERIASQLVSQGWSVTEDFLPAATVAKLAQQARRLELRRAGVGKPRALNNDIRGDRILWLEPPNVSALQQACLERFEQLRLELNRSLKLGLFEFESHIAHYPVGAFYRKHLDSFQQDNRRTLSCVLYLNQRWQAQHGGQLRLYLNSHDYKDISPQGGTLVVFFSDQFWHEVLPATRDRLSFTGWFKTRS